MNVFARWWSRYGPYQPMVRSREHLDTQYRNGTWDFLWSIDELARFSVVAGYCRFFKPGGALLEVGCGEGVLQDRLDPSLYRRYVGIDLSDHATTRANQRVSERAAGHGPHPSVTFIAVDALAYHPDEAFDVIIFNESLEYFERPAEVVERYSRFLTPDGIFIASIHRGAETMRWERIWRLLEAICETRDGTVVTNAKGLMWDIRVLVPRTHDRRG